MFLRLENGRLVSGGDVLTVITRTDLVPVPVTVEITTRYTDELDTGLEEGKTIEVGHLPYKMKIVKQQLVPLNIVQGKQVYGAIKATAFLLGCERIGANPTRAIITENSSLGAIYRACGATVRLANDFNIPSFCCLMNEIPSVRIAAVLQEEGGVIAWRDGKIGFYRLEDLFSQKAKVRLPLDTLAGQECEYLVNQEIPTYFSTDPDGNMIIGNIKRPRRRQYVARTTQRQLVNLSKVLLNTRDIAVGYDPTLNAGDMVGIGDTDMIIVTAAHEYNSSDSDNPRQSTHLWLGVLDK